VVVQLLLNFVRRVLKNATDALKKSCHCVAFLGLSEAEGEGAKFLLILVNIAHPRVEPSLILCLLAFFLYLEITGDEDLDLIDADGIVLHI